MDAIERPEGAESTNQTDVSFQDVGWLQTWGLGPENVLEYFYMSPFYDRSCNNEHCRMQGVRPEDGLRNMVGLEYALISLPAEDQFGPPVPLLPTPPSLTPPQAAAAGDGGSTSAAGNAAAAAVATAAPPPPRRLYVIYKQHRKSQTIVDVKSIYYVLEGVIYQAPTVQSLISSRLDKVSFLMDRALASLTSLRSLNPECGYDWKWNAAVAERRRRAAARGRQAAAAKPKAGEGRRAAARTDAGGGAAAAAAAGRDATVTMEVG